jgi:hypothetical protein
MDPNWLTAFSTMGTFLVAGAALIVAWRQLGDGNRTSAATLIHDLSLDFFTPEALLIIKEIENDTLSFEKDRDKGARFVTASGAVYKVDDIDHRILDPLEALGSLAALRLINLQLAYDYFIWYIEKVWNNGAIIDYVNWSRTDLHDDDLFVLLETLYYELELLAPKYISKETKRRNSLAKKYRTLITNSRQTSVE